jgi:hypothetical protein
MSSANGKGTNGTTLPEAVDEHGGHWFNNSGTAAMQMQIAQVQAAREAQAKLVQLEARRQVAIRALQTEADQAQADFVTCMKSTDYEGVARAARRLTRAECALVNIGAYDK